MGILAIAIALLSSPERAMKKTWRRSSTYERGLLRSPASRVFNSKLKNQQAIDFSSMIGSLSQSRAEAQRQGTATPKTSGAHRIGK
jgi:hypothetical protein